MKSYLLEVLATNTFQHRHVMLNTTEDMIKMGFRPQSVRSVACFEKTVLKGFHLTSVPLTFGEIPGQQEVIDCFVQYPALFNLRHHPVIGEIQEGLYAGKQVSLFTQSEIRSHFSLDAIRLAIKRGTPYLQTRWRYADKYSDAQHIYTDPEQSMTLSVLRDHYGYTALRLTENDHMIFRQKVKQVAQALYTWSKTEHDPKNPLALEKLARIYIGLTKTIRCEEHHHKLLDSLYHMRMALMHNRVPGLRLSTIIAALNRVASKQ